MKLNNISISSSFNYNIKIEEQINLIAETGFTFFSFGSNLDHFDYLDKNKRNMIKQELIDKNIVIDIIHGQSLHQDKDLNLLQKTMEVAREFKTKTIVIHISPFSFMKEQYDDILSLLLDQQESFIRLVENDKIKIALENVSPNHETDLLLSYYSQVESPWIGICYDSSHDQINGPRSFAFLEKTLNNIYAVHLSDRIRDFVDHVIPGEGFIEFDKIINYLRKSSFKGPYLFEVMMTHSIYKEPKEFLNNAFIEGSKIIGEIENTKLL